MKNKPIRQLFTTVQMLFSHSCSRLLFRHTGLFLTKTQIHKLHSFPLKQHFHQFCRVYCVSRGRVTDVRHLRPFCQNICYRHRLEGHKLIDMFWKRPPKTTTRRCSHSLAFPYHSGHLGRTFTASHHPTVSFHFYCLYINRNKTFARGQAMSHKGVEYSPTGHIISFRQSFLKEKCQKGYDTPVVMISSNRRVTKQTLKMIWQGSCSQSAHLIQGYFLRSCDSMEPINTDILKVPPDPLL